MSKKGIHLLEGGIEKSLNRRGSKEKSNSVSSQSLFETIKRGSK